MNEFLDTESVFTLPSSNQFFVVQNVSKKLDVDTSVPVLLLDENQSGFVNNFFCSNNFQEDVDAFFASDDLGSELLRFDKEKCFSSFINGDDDMGEIIHGQKEDSNHSEVDVEGVSDNEAEVVPAPKCEKTIFLCSECPTPFDSMEECKEHMIKAHKLDLSNLVPEESSLPAESPETATSSLSVPNKEHEPVISEADSNQADCVQLLPDVRCEETNETHDCQAENDETSSLPQVEALEPSVGIEEPKMEAEHEAEGPGPEAEHEPEGPRRKARREPEEPGPEAEFLKDPDFVSKPYRCDFLGCCIRFTTHEWCVVHQDCHEVNSKMYVCSQENCTKRFSNWKQCSMHLWKAHKMNIDLISCPLCCTYKTWSFFLLRTHIKVHFAEKRYACEQCDKKFKQKAQLQNHLAQVHAKKISKENPIADDSNKWYTEKVCKICSKTYADAKCLRKHVQAVHRKMKPYVCYICGHKSAKKAMLQIHIRSHTGEKPYACSFEECSYRTGDHNSLRRHQMIHEGKRPYRCSFCSFTCVQTCNLKRHISAKHSEEQGGVCFCTLCPFATVNPTLFKNHMNDHSKGLIEGNAPTVTDEAPPVSTLPTDDEDTTNCFPTDEGIVTGGITIPANPNQEPIILLPPNCNSEFETNALIEAL